MTVMASQIAGNSMFVLQFAQVNINENTKAPH